MFHFLRHWILFAFSGCKIRDSPCPPTYTTTITHLFPRACFTLMLLRFEHINHLLFLLFLWLGQLLANAFLPSSPKFPLCAPMSKIWKPLPAKVSKRQQKNAPAVSNHSAKWNHSTSKKSSSACLFTVLLWHLIQHKEPKYTHIHIYMHVHTHIWTLLQWTILLLHPRGWAQMF